MLNIVANNFIKYLLLSINRLFLTIKQFLKLAIKNI